MLQNRQDEEEKGRHILEIEQTIAASHDAQTQSESRLREDMEKKESLSGRQKNFFVSREELAEQMTALDKEVYRLASAICSWVLFSSSSLAASSLCISPLLLMIS